MKMKKDFQKWHNKKSTINEVEKRPFFHEKELWFCSVGANVGFEQDGVGEDFQRPIVVMRKFNNEIFWAIPLSKTKKRNKYYFEFPFSGTAMSVAILSQIRLIDAQRLSRKIGDISEKDFRSLIEKLKALLP